MANNESTRLNISENIDTISELEVIMQKVKELHSSFQHGTNSVFKFEYTYRDRLLGNYRTELVSESSYVSKQVAILYQMGFFTYEPIRHNATSNTNEKQNNKKNPIDFSTVEELISFIQAKMEPLQKKIDQKKELAQTKKRKEELEKKINTYHYYNNLREIRNFTNSSINNLLMFSIRSNSQISKLLNNLVESFKGTKDYGKIEVMVEHCKNNNYEQLGVVIEILQDKMSLIKDVDIIKYLETDKLISSLTFHTQCISRDVLKASFKHFPNMQGIIDHIFGDREFIHINQLFQEFDRILSGYFKSNKIENIQQLQNSLHECEKKISDLEAQGLGADESEKKYSILNRMLNDANSVKVNREKYYQTSSREEYQQLIAKLQLSDQDLIKICMQEKYNEIIQLERNIDKLASNNDSRNKHIVDDYIFQLTNVYFDVIKKFMELKKDISLTLYAYGTKKRTSEEIKHYNEVLDSIYNEFIKQFEKNKKSLSLMEKSSVSKLIPGGSLKNISIFRKSPIQYRGLRIQRHSLIFDNTMANFQDFYRRLSSPLNNYKKKPSIYSYSYIMNPLDEEVMLDINSTLNDMFYEMGQNGLKQNESGDTDEKRKK